MNDSPRVLLIDDSADDRLLILRELRREFPGMEAHELCHPNDLNGLLEQSFDLIIMEFQLQGVDALTVLRSIRRRDAHCPVIMFTCKEDESVATAAMKAGLSDYVLKRPNHYLRLASVARSAVEKTAAQRRATELEGRLESILGRVNVGIFRAQANGLILEANPAFLGLVGWKRLPGDTHLQELYYHPELYSEHLRELTERAQFRNREIEICRADGTPLWVTITQVLGQDKQGELIIDGLVSDISERVALEENLRKQQKMESIGQLAAGVAHDFNNLLTIVQGYTNLLLAESNDRNVIEAMEKISGAAERATTLTRQLLTFGRRQTIVPDAVDINDVVNNVSGLLGHVLGENIQLRMECQPGMPQIMADPGMMEQALVNLASNAREAMLCGGTVTIRTGVVEIDPIYARQNLEAEQGRFVWIRFSDTGRGIDAATLSHLFEPFYTTKEDGKGPGLGLAAVYGIVKQHRGWIDVTSKVGQGTTFSIYLPCVNRSVMKENDSEPMMPDEEMNRETVLVVEDEPELLKLVSGILKSHGYKVLQAASGLRALDVWQHHRDNIDLLLTDMKMPDGIGGLQLAEMLTSQKPRLKVLYTSGYSPDLVSENFVLREDVNFLSKPYPPEKLLSVVRQCLMAEAG